MTCVPVTHLCAYMCVRHPYATLGYIYLVPRLHLLFISSSPSPCHPGFLQLRPCALFLLGATLLAPRSLRVPSPRFLARFLSSSLSASPSLSYYLGSDSICRTMLFTMWLHAGGPCSLGEMPELRRRVSLQSTMLLGTQSADRAACSGVNFRGSSSAFSRLMILQNGYFDLMPRFQNPVTGEQWISK